MSKDYIGPFGPESIEAAANAHWQAVDGSEINDRERAENRESMRLALSAAVSALERDALAKRLEDVLRTTATGQSSPRYRLLAEAGIADLFPTEGKAEHGC